MAEKIIFQLELDERQLAAKTIEVSRAIKEVKDQQKLLNEVLNVGGKLTDEQQKELEELRVQEEKLKVTQQQLNREMRNTARVMTAQEGSLNELRGNLNLLTQRYDALSGAERNNARVGGQLVKQIQQQRAEVTKAEEATGRFQRNVGNYPKFLQPAVAGFAKLAAGITGAALVLGTLSAKAGEAIDKADEQAKAEALLEKALGRRSQALINQSRAVQESTRFGDEAVLTQQAFLASLDFTEEQIQDIIEASIGLSAATGKELDFSVRNLAKTYSGLQGELGELIPQLKSFTKEELQAGKATEFAKEQFGGLAEEAAKAGKGGLVQFGNIIGDIQESFGLFIFQGLRPVLPLLKTFTGSISDSLRPIELQSEKLEEERRVIISGLQQIAAYKEGTEDRTKLVEELTRKYPGLIEQIDLEKASNEEVAKSIQEVNDGYLQRIFFAERQEEIEKEIALTEKDRIKFRQQQSDLLKLLVNNNKEYLNGEQEIVNRGEDNISFLLRLAKAQREALKAKREDADFTQFGLKESLESQINSLTTYINTLEQTPGKIAAYEKNISNLKAEVEQLRIQLFGVNEETEGQGGAAAKVTETLETLRASLNQLKADREKIAITDEAALTANGKQIESIEKQITALEKLGFAIEKVEGKTNQDLLNEELALYEKSLLDLQALFEAGIIDEESYNKGREAFALARLNAIKRVNGETSTEYKRAYLELVQLRKSFVKDIEAVDEEAELNKTLSAQREQTRRAELQAEQRFLTDRNFTQEQYDAELLQIQKDGLQAQLDILKDAGQQYTSQYLEIENELIRLKKEGVEARKKFTEEDLNAILGQVSVIAQNAEQVNQSRLENELDTNEKRREAEIKSAENSIRNAERRNQTIEQINEQYDSQEAQLRKEAGQRAKRVAKIQATIDTAQMAVAAYKALVGIPYVGPALGAAAAGAAIAYGVARINEIDQQQFAKGGLIPQAQQGMILDGPSHAQGGIPARMKSGGMVELEGGEAIINKRSTRIFGNQLSAINSFQGYGRKFGTGGITTRLQDGGLISRSITSPVNDRLEVRQLNKLLSSLPAPVVTVEDINAGQSRRTKVTSRANI